MLAQVAELEARQNGIDRWLLRTTSYVSHSGSYFGAAVTPTDGSAVSTSLGAGSAVGAG